MTVNHARILVTGAGGWIGRAVVARLRDNGMNVRCAHRTTAEVDLANEAAASDVVIHAGSGYSNARRDVVEGGLAHVIAVARGCARTENAVVFLSSAKVYGWAPDSSEHGRDCNEDSMCRGADHFAVGKLVAEEVLSSAAQRCIVLRISNVYGRDTPAKYAFGTMLLSAMTRGRIKLDCTGESRRDLVHFDDVVTIIEAATSAALRDETPGRRTYNVASGRLTSLIEVANTVAEATDAVVETVGNVPISSPSLMNCRVRQAGFIDRFIDPTDGVRELMMGWKERPWQPI